MAYEMVMPYHLHMPSYFLETFTEYPEINLPVGKLSLSCQRVYVRMLNQNALLSLFFLQKFR